MTHKTAAPGVSFRASATLTAIYRAITCTLCLGSLNAAYAQGIRLTPSPSVAVRVPVASANGAAPAAIQANYIVAIVNSEPITSTEVRARLIRYEQRLAAIGAPMPSRIDLSKEVLEDVINEKIQLQRARDTNVRVDDRTIDAAVQNFATQNKVSVEELRTRSSADGIGFTQIRSDIQNQLLVQKLRERDVLGNIDISDSEIETFLKTATGASPSGEVAIDIAQILVAVPENATESQTAALRERAMRIYNRAIKGDDFFKLAQENSDAKDARTGGQMGFRSIERYPTLFVEAIKDKKVADIVGPIKSGAGFHVLQLLAKETAAASNLSVTQTNARHILLKTSPSLTEAAAKAKLASLKQQIESGKIDFASAAKANSQDASAATGGALGWASPGLFVPEFENAMNALPIGKISEPVVSRFGVHLMVVDARKQTPLTTSEQRDTAKSALREKKFDDAYANWIRDLRSNAYVEYRDLQQ
ncbi:MAG: peptidylprolyl isomerase [Burkholderiaceae bacterium]